MRGGLADGGQGPPPEQRQAAPQSRTQKVGRGRRTHGIPPQMLAGHGDRAAREPNSTIIQTGPAALPGVSPSVQGDKAGVKEGGQSGVLVLRGVASGAAVSRAPGSCREGQPRGAEKGLQEDPGQPQRATLILQAGEGGTGAPPGCGDSSDAPDFGDAKFGGAQAMPSARHPCLELMSPAVRLPHPEPLKDITSAALAQEWASCSFRSSPHPTHCSEICRKRVPSPPLTRSPHCAVSRTHGYFILWVMSRY